MENFWIWPLLLHSWKQEFKATDKAETYAKLKEKVPSLYWFKKHHEGYTSLEHNEFLNRPLIVHSGVILNAVETNPSTSTRSRLSNKLGIFQISVIQTLHAHGKVNKCCREVSYELTENQTLNRVKACQNLSENPHDDLFVRCWIMTGNEKWMHFNNQDKQRQWLNCGGGCGKWQNRWQNAICSRRRRH